MFSPPDVFTQRRQLSRRFLEDTANQSTIDLQTCTRDVRSSTRKKGSYGASIFLPLSIAA